MRLGGHFMTDRYPLPSQKVTTPTLLVDPDTGLAWSTSNPMPVATTGTVDLGATDNAVLDALAASLALLDDTGVGKYETVAASQTAQALGATGAAGDWLESLLVTPETTSPGVVTILDNAISMIMFVGGASSVLTLHPFTIMIRARSVSGAWKVTTGANVHVFATGNFT
jgi:hypothetical protein